MHLPTGLQGDGLQRRISCGHTLPVMDSNTQHRPHSPAHDEPDQFEPGSLPVEPDEGPAPAAMPDDPEHERAPQVASWTSFL